MRLKYYDKHDTEIQVGMLLRHDDGAIERVLEAVSYTHLDVYKRQALYSRCPLGY